MIFALTASHCRACAYPSGTNLRRAAGLAAGLNSLAPVLDNGGVNVPDLGCIRIRLSQCLGGAALGINAPDNGSVHLIQGGGVKPPLAVGLALAARCLCFCFCLDPVRCCVCSLGRAARTLLGLTFSLLRLTPLLPGQLLFCLCRLRCLCVVFFSLALLPFLFVSLGLYLGLQAQPLCFPLRLGLALTLSQLFCDLLGFCLLLRPLFSLSLLCLSLLSPPLLSLFAGPLFKVAQTPRFGFPSGLLLRFLLCLFGSRPRGFLLQPLLFALLRLTLRARPFFTGGTLFCLPARLPLCLLPLARFGLRTRAVFRVLARLFRPLALSAAVTRQMCGIRFAISTLECGSIWHRPRRRVSRAQKRIVLLRTATGLLELVQPALGEMGKPAVRKRLNKGGEVFRMIAVLDFFPELELRLHRNVGALRLAAAGADGRSADHAGCLGRLPLRSFKRGAAAGTLRQPVERPGQMAKTAPECVNKFTR